VEDIFAQMEFGKLALIKIKPTDPNFRLYKAGWLGKNNERDVMEVTGAVFRTALKGRRKGELCIIVPGTERTAYITAAEIDQFKE